MAQFLPQEFIRTKRDGGALASSDINQFIEGITSGVVSEGQIAAFAMSVFFNGLEPKEQVDLTMAMMSSGDVLDWSNVGLDGPVVDKHSTGGVGDKVSLMLAPIVAACGGFVPMISGRGLGHTGGTLDKFDSIPGYDAIPDIDRFFKIVKEVGCSVIGQTDQLAPADKRFYAIRDVTATVESIHLITASILSKKLSAGLEALVMDVKYGSGSFMGNYEYAYDLAANIVCVAKQAELPITAVLTDMNQVLGLHAGNGVEVMECVDFLTGKKLEPRLKKVTLELAAQMLVITGLAESAEQGVSKAEDVLRNGQAAEVFARMVVAHGGPIDFMEKVNAYLTPVPIVRAVLVDATGYVKKIDTRAIGLAVVALGGGRTRADQKIDHGVGLTNMIGIGEELSDERPLCFLHSRNESTANQAEAMIRHAITVSDEVVSEQPVIQDILN